MEPDAVLKAELVKRSASLQRLLTRRQRLRRTLHRLDLDVRRDKRLLRELMQPSPSPVGEKIVHDLGDPRRPRVIRGKKG